MAASVEPSGLRREADRQAAAAAHDLAEALRHLERAETILQRKDVEGLADVLADIEDIHARLARSVADTRKMQPPPHPAPTLVRRQELPVSQSAPRAARSFCRATCDEWELPGPVTSTLTDLASELVANAVRHTRSPMILSLELSAHTITVSVWDDGVGAPHLLPYRPGISERGIGLRLVKQLSTDWGWNEAENGKWVWARLALRPPE